MAKIFQYCISRAHVQYKSIGPLVCGDVRVEYNVLNMTVAGICSTIFIMSLTGENITTFTFTINDASELVVSVYEFSQNALPEVSYSTEVQSEEELSSFIFQVQTVLKTYDLGGKFFGAMESLHKKYRDANETETINLV